MFASVIHYISNVLPSLSGSKKSANKKNDIVLFTGDRTSMSMGGLKAALTTAFLFVVGILYCLYCTGNSMTRFVTLLAYGQQSLEVYDSVDEAMSGVHGVLTAADMYEPGFRIRNSGLCTEHTQLLVLITSAAAPSHSQHRQAIRMTWMNRYGPSVTMAFLVGTPQMSETDPIAQLLEAEENALRIRLNNLAIKHSDKPNENNKSEPHATTADTYVNPRFYQFSSDREPHLGEALDARSMHGLNEAEQAVQRVLGREHSRYGDLIQCQSRDTYNNLTLKSIAALEWTREFCPSARYLLKTDDDMFIDVHRLLRFINQVETNAAVESTDMNGFHSVNPINGNLNELPNVDEDKFQSTLDSSNDIELPPTIWGRLAHGWPVIRERGNKYCVPREQYPGHVFPDFCTGPAYLMTRSAVRPLYEGALGRDLYTMNIDEDDEQYDNDDDNEIDNKHLKKDYGDSNRTLFSVDNEKAASVTSVTDTEKNTIPYLKLEDVYLTGVTAERLTRQAAERRAWRERKDKEKISSGGDKRNQKTSVDKSNLGQLRNGKSNKLKAEDIIVKVRRVHNDQFANVKITGRALERAVCSAVNSDDNTSGSKKNKKDHGVISLHMVNYYEQFDLWCRLMDGRSKCKS